ncbi:UNVERIFIED_CONTAM: hypothetical protein PYX00_004772 [Menopon gallinae]|uniref:Uncharacterized protein n=1 Tax=Menopon gallinae TaxID=328185 RepID=A0AAW2I6M4_9NEOP
MPEELADGLMPGQGVPADSEARGNHGGAVLALGAMVLKLLGLVTVSTLKIILLKGVLLAKASLLISVFLFFDSIRKKVGQFKDTYKITPTQYPEREPDLSGYGYPSYSEKELLQAALEKTLSSWPKTSSGIEDGSETTQTYPDE